LVENLSLFLTIRRDSLGRAGRWRSDVVEVTGRLQDSGLLIFFSIRHALLVFNGSGVDFETNLRPLRSGEEKCGSRFLLDDFTHFIND
jgi:hypothetical protein